MTPFQAVLLGLLQGLTEFLPVSSSGHLVIAQSFFNFSSPPVLFDVIVHLGTLTAVIAFFFDRLKSLDYQLIKLAIIGTVPAVLVGLTIKPFLDTIFSSLLIVAIGLFVTGVLLTISYFFANTSHPLDKLSIKNSFIIGLFQALAIIPGISRSGSTVVAGLQTGLKKDDAFFFSFLLAIPAILGAQVLELTDIVSLNQLLAAANIIGFITAAIAGFFSLKLLKLVIDSTKLHYFATYCFALSFLLFGFSVL